MRVGVSHVVLHPPNMRVLYSCGDAPAQTHSANILRAVDDYPSTFTLCAIAYPTTPVAFFMTRSECAFSN